MRSSNPFLFGRHFSITARDAAGDTWNRLAGEEEGARVILRGMRFGGVVIEDRIEQLSAMKQAPSR